MLNVKTLRRLLIITSICAIPVILIALKTGTSAIKNKNALFLPDLLKYPDQIAKIVLQDHEQSLNLTKEDGVWHMQEHGNYPVMTSKVEEFLFSLADLRIVEPKTTNAEYYAQLDVNDISEPNSNALLVTVANNTNDNIARLYIGKREGVRLGEEYQEHIFVRKTGEDQTWLVQGILSLSSDFRDWVEQPLIGLLDPDQIRRLEIQKPRSETIVISKDKLNEEDFTLETLQVKKGKMLDIDSVNAVPFEVAELEYNDVLPSADMNINWSGGVTAKLATFPGLEIVLNIVKIEDKVLAKVHANTDAAAANDLVNKVHAFNAAKDPWVFELPKDFYTAISMNNTDFLKNKTADN